MVSLVMSDDHRVVPGTYIIRSVLSNTTVNLVVKDPGEEPYVCIWKATQSPTQLWQFEPTEKGYFLKNPSTDRYVSYAEGSGEGNGVAVLGIKRPVEWLVDEIDDHFIIKLVSKPDMVLDIRSSNKRDGAPITIYGFHGGLNQRWFLQRVSDTHQPHKSRGWLGRVPPGIYWLGQPHEEGGLSRSRSAPSSAALTVAAQRPLTGTETTSANLCATGLDSPWPNQIWVLESGLHGYKLLNMGTNSYLNYVNQNPVMESAGFGDSGIGEWVLSQAHTQNDIVTWWIHPSTDHDMVLGISKGDTFNTMRVRPLREYQKEFETNWNYTEWRFEPVDEDVSGHFP